MSTTMQLDQQKLYLAIAKRAKNPNAILSAAEEAALNIFLPSNRAEPGLPESAPGDARGTNALRRTNWFNGRFLTAEALRRQDTYHDARARLDAHLLMPGVAYGLGVSGSGLNAMPVVEDRSTPPTAGGFGQTQKLTLSSGLAFDHVGRPILVSQPFEFTIEQLIAAARATPRRVAPGGLDFAPCVCLVPDPAGPTGGAPAVRPGPYVLVIEPGEVPEGEAKVYGEACAGANAPVTCQSETWRGAFGLSLVRVPLELPEEDGLASSWALRGTLSAWWFDVFEHSLIKRWDPEFARNDGFRKPAGPGRHEAGAVALAMVWLGTDGSALFLDSWIPRRSIVATPGEDWHRTRFGAPPRAAAWARIHQFQAMLAESLAREALVQNNEIRALNLWRRGFRHIPPIGFLPLDPAAVGARGDLTASTGIAALDRLIAAAGGRVALVSRLIAAARQQAFSYFRGTTVIPYCVVALHDDDVLEDLSNAFDKDPVQVARRIPREQTPNNPDGSTTNVPANNAFLERLGEIFEVMGLDELVNRRTEIVKVVIPLQGLTRAHPVLGVVSEDARDQLGTWLGSQPPSWYGREARLTDAANLSGLRQLMPLEMLPRHFAVYVKQRMVLLEVLVMIIELLQLVVILARDIQRGAKLASTQTPTMTTTAAYRTAYMQQPAEKRALAEAALAEPGVRNAVVTAAMLSSTDLRVPARNAAFADAVTAQEAALATQITDPAERGRVALDRVADSYAAEYPGFQAVQIIAAVQPATEANATIADLRFQAAQLPLRDRNATVAEATVADRVAIEANSFETAEATVAYGAMRGALDAKAAKEVVAEAPAGLTVADVLRKPPREAAALLGGEDKLASFVEVVGKQRAEAAVTAKAVTESPPKADVIAKMEEAAGRGEDTAAVLEKARDSARGVKEKAALDAAAKMARTLGPDATLAIARLVPRKL